MAEYTFKLLCFAVALYTGSGIVFPQKRVWCREPTLDDALPVWWITCCCVLTCPLVSWTANIFTVLKKHGCFRISKLHLGILTSNITFKTPVQAVLRPQNWLNGSTVFSPWSASEFLITSVFMIGMYWIHKPGELGWWSQRNGVQSNHLQLSSWVILILSLSLMKIWWHKKSFCYKLLWPPPHACSAEREKRIGGEKSMCC